MFKIIGGSTNERVILNIENLSKLTQKGLAKAFYKIGTDLRRDTKKAILKQPKHGRLYLIKGKLHRASAPGEPPANLSGALKNAITFDVVGSNRLEFGVKENIKYGKILELGSKTTFSSITGFLSGNQKINKKRGGPTILPRPYLLPTIKANFSKIETHFKEQIIRTIKGFK